MAYPESSVDVVWLVDYNHLQNRQHQMNDPPPGPKTGAAGHEQQQQQVETNYRGRLPAEERFIVLYESKLYRTSASDNVNDTLVNNVDQSNGLAEGKQEDRSGANEPNNQDRPARGTGKGYHEISLYNSRILIQETRAQINEANDDDGSSPPPPMMTSILKESQIIIQSVQVDDSARYKCIGSNAAGQSNFEFLLRVGRSPNKPSRDSTSLFDINNQQQQQHEENDIQKSSASSAGRQFNSGSGSAGATRDQRANGSASSWWVESSTTTTTTTTSGAGAGGSRRKGQGTNNHSAAPSGSSSPVAPTSGAKQPGNTNGQQTAAATSQQQQTTSPTVWLKGSATFQIVMVVVSCLMGTVIVAFLLVCIVIYQIKPTGQQPQQHILLPAMYNKQTGGQNNESSPMITTTTSTTTTLSPQTQPNGRHHQPPIQLNGFLVAPQHQVGVVFPNGTVNSNGMAHQHHPSDSFVISSNRSALVNADQLPIQPQLTRLTESSTLNTINSSLISTVGDQPQAQQTPTSSTRRLTPILICDPISGQTPIHLINQQQQQQHLISPMRYHRSPTNQLVNASEQQHRWRNNATGSLTRGTNHMNYFQ